MTATETLRANIEARRSAAGIAVTALERRAALGDGTLRKFIADEGRTLGLDVVEKLAAALGCTVPELMVAPAEVPSGGRPSALQQIHPDQLVASPLNPRKATALDADSIADLARSIAEKGVLQNLIARPFTAEGVTLRLGGIEMPMFEIVAGERRWRAACHALKHGLVAPDFTLPVSVRELSDDELVELALVENIDRADMTPLEEADALAFLHERARGTTRDFTKRLSESTGKTERWVQKRVKLARALAPEARDRLGSGGISLQMALELSELPAAAQALALDHIAGQRWGWDNAERLRTNLAMVLPRVDEALFKRAEYDGGIVSHDGRDYFADEKQARRLQAEAVTARRAAIEKKGGTVETTERAWEWREAEAGESGGITLLVVQRSRFEVEERRNQVPVRSAGGDPAAGSEAARAEAAAAAAERIRAHREWRSAMMTAVARDETAMLRALLLTTAMRDEPWPNAPRCDQPATAAWLGAIGIEAADWDVFNVTRAQVNAVIAALGAADLRTLQRAWRLALLAPRPDDDDEDEDFAGIAERALAAWSATPLPDVLLAGASERDDNMFWNDPDTDDAPTDAADAGGED